MRTLGWVAVAGLMLVAILGAITSLGGAFHHSREEREALRAFTAWRESPSPETEKAWETARERAWDKEMKLRGAAFLVGALALVAAGAVAYRLKRGSRVEALGDEEMQ